MTAHESQTTNGKPPGDMPRSARGGRGRARDMADPAVAGLVDLGLTLTEARAYVSLLGQSMLSAAEVAASSKLARPKVYEALRLLEERGFCHPVAGESVTRFRAVPPEAALPSWLAHREHERQLMQDHDDRTASDLVKLLPDPATADASSAELYDYFEAVSGRVRTSEALTGIITRAEQSLSHMTQPPFVQPRARWNVAETDALRRGVALRTLYTPAAIGDDDRWRPIVEAGGQIRVADAIPMKLLIRDGAEAMVSLRDPASGEQAPNSIIIRHPDLVRPLKQMFDREWKAATRLDLYRRRTQETAQ